MAPRNTYRTNDPDNRHSYHIATRFIMMQEIGSQAGGIFLMLACIILSLFLFHDLMSQSPWTWLLLTAGVVAVVFSLAYWIRKTIRQSIDEEKQHIEQAKKVAEADRLNRLAENRKKEYAAKKEEELKQERIRQKVEELLASRGEEFQLEKDIFLTEIAEETSMLKIWSISLITRRSIQLAQLPFKRFAKPCHEILHAIGIAFIPHGRRAQRQHSVRIALVPAGKEICYHADKRRYFRFCLAVSRGAGQDDFLIMHHTCLLVIRF